MDSKHAILWPVIISLVVHLTLITATGAIDLRQNIPDMEILAVSLEEFYPDIPYQEENEWVNEKNPTDNDDENKVAIDDGWREDTVDLGSLDTKYADYLQLIKRRILRVWEYPQKAFEKNEEGNVIVRLSIDADGKLAHTVLLTSSGFPELDKGALNVIKDVAPFAPLPEYYNLSRLHVVALFRYRIRN
ncbi:MAG: energy transducer TonB [Deltaproteobacteria bacterium]|nr:energy transducer TonB [Deltaproteobacteria bacterium]HQM43696.1 TonB family protein [Smithellaceae bacterium]